MRTLSFSLADWLIWCLLIALLATYLGLVFRQRRSRRPWRGWRTAFWIVGIALLLLATWPPLAQWGHHSLRGHMVQHLLIGMLAPLGLVLAAPLTLLWRTLPAPVGRRVTGLLHSPVMRVLSHPIPAGVLNIGGMYVLYLTPLYASMHHPVIHHLVHLHFLAAGCLFTWSIAGPDPAPHRPGFLMRLGVLFASVATHGYLSKLMYAHRWPRGTHHSLEEIQDAAQWMYYGGDLAEALLSVALFAGWYQKRQRRHQPPRVVFDTFRDR